MRRKKRILFQFVTFATTKMTFLFLLSVVEGVVL